MITIPEHEYTDKPIILIVPPDFDEHLTALIIAKLEQEGIHCPIVNTDPIEELSKSNSFIISSNSDKEWYKECCVVTKHIPKNHKRKSSKEI